MQYSIKRLFILTAIVAVLFGDVGRYWPLGTAVAVVVSVPTGIVLLAFGSIKSWKLVVWTAIIFLGSLVTIRYALHARRLSESLQDWPDHAVEAVVLLAGAVLFGIVATIFVATFPEKRFGAAMNSIIKRISQKTKRE